MGLPAKLRQLTRLRCAIFQTSYNPTSIRTGAKYLRTRLRGPSMVQYYPEEFNIARIARQYPELEMVDEDERQRLQDVADRRKRGKGAPKKTKKDGQGYFSRFLCPRSCKTTGDSRRTQRTKKTAA